MQVLHESLRLGGTTLMRYFGKIQNIDLKENQSNIVTEADLASEWQMVERILKHHPDHSIIAEETGFRQSGSDYTWIIDPLDGTSNFASGIPWFGVLVALLHKEELAAGMYLPFYNLLYVAEKDKGAYRNGERISVSSQASLSHVLLAYSLDYSEDQAKLNRKRSSSGNWYAMSATCGLQTAPSIFVTLPMVVWVVASTRPPKYGTLPLHG
jgi:myo-inositol-1(or 4)-monophosphatase